MLLPSGFVTQPGHTGIRWWSPTQLLICRSEACVWQSGRDAQFSSVYGRMWQRPSLNNLMKVAWMEQNYGYGFSYADELYSSPNLTPSAPTKPPRISAFPKFSHVTKLSTSKFHPDNYQPQ
ncbi:unnamed protein product [Diplocarpon coronariae]